MGVGAAPVSTAAGATAGCWRALPSARRATPCDEARASTNGRTAPVWPEMARASSRRCRSRKCVSRCSLRR
eukprot:scaffold39107_cov61-Phaeocystis_antarctica.AAC.2